MFNPSDLEGEVDHSFFDSDHDNTSLSRDGGKKMENTLKAQSESPQAHKKLSGKDITSGGQSQTAKGANKQWEPFENHKRSSTDERKEKSCQPKEEDRSRASGTSSFICTLDVISNSNDAEKDINLLSERPNAETKEGDYEYSQSPNESEEEALPVSAKHAKGSKGRNKISPKKRIRRRCTRSPSPTSTDTSADADSESCCSSSNASILDSPTLPRPNKSVSPGVRGIRLGSVGSQGVPVTQTEGSEDTVTDVSPLSSPDCSPLPSLTQKHPEAEEGSAKEQHEGSVPSSGTSNIHQDEDSDHYTDECSLSSESQLGGKLVLRCPGGRHRKNYSFTDDEVRSIDQENQRLLRALSRLSSGPRPGSTAGKKTRVTGNSPSLRIPHSALNRQRVQKRIERENLAFLKRLESVKPTPGLKRSEQLADYQRQFGYLGGPSYSVYTPTSYKGKSTSRTPSVGDCSRTASTTTDSSHTPASRSKKLSAARPSWC